MTWQPIPGRSFRISDDSLTNAPALKAAINPNTAIHSWIGYVRTPDDHTVEFVCYHPAANRPVPRHVAEGDAGVVRQETRRAGCVR
jgi:hypothetical protein